MSTTRHTPLKPAGARGTTARREKGKGLRQQPAPAGATSGIHKVTKKWTTGDGRKIRICDMIDEHLLNTISMCRRKHPLNQLAMPFPSMISGEMASFFAEGDYDRFQQSGPEESFPLYDDFCLEAERRGLEPWDG